MTIRLQPPVTYQGGKQRIAAAILDHINPDPQRKFYDLCCGSGSVSLELVNRGHAPSRIVMLDRGPWGLFWKKVGDGTFDIGVFAAYCDAVPKDRTRVKAHIQALAKQPPEQDTAYVFLLLQATTIGGSAVWADEARWHTAGFRDYWQPTATSSRRSPVNPMMPMPDTILERVAAICEKMRGVAGFCEDIRHIQPDRDAVVYIDPPYAGTTGYGYTFDVGQYIASVGAECYVSEGRPIGSDAVLLTAGSAKGGMTGSRAKAPHQEWLSRFPRSAAAVA